MTTHGMSTRPLPQLDLLALLLGERRSVTAVGDVSAALHVVLARNSYPFGVKWSVLM